ncbi:polycystic kidney disease protein 1-like 2 [Stylophora pistillata]|uniref:polycystic kidney disease protein 1-like 2 n=1 Tax=Stylophora pistillata TaxID=50429 RepID=UPI000C04E9C0|nr:polycystic kidney disease protein 1-like 2 [Stylophora pistillata]
MNFGDGTNRMTIPLGGTRSINIHNDYAIPGILRVNMTMRNDVSSVNLTHVVDVQRRIKDLRILGYHTGGDAGYGAPGRGPNNAAFPLEYDVLLVANISDGTEVTYRWDFGDGTPTVETKETNVSHRFAHPEHFLVTVKAKNSISNASVGLTIRIMRSISNVTFENDSPTVHEFNTTLLITIGQQGTDSCFLVDLGNNTRILYKGFSDVSCDEELKTTNDIRVLPSLKFNVIFEYWQEVNYAVKLTALNSVSRITIHGWVIILHLPCDFPVIRIPDAGRSFGIRRKYFRADYVTIKSRCTINCLASRKTSFHWELTWISSEVDNGTTLQTDSFDKNQSVLIVPQRSLPYGTFVVRLNVSMVGLPLVHRHMNAYIEILPSPLLAKIIGGNAWIQSVYKKVVLDASSSHDPDYGSEDKHGLDYFWYCKTATEDYEFPSVPEKNFTSANGTGANGCFRNGTRRLPVRADILEIQPNVLWVNTTYIFKLFVTKDSRMAVFYVQVSLTYGDPPTMSIRTPYDEFPGKKNPSAKLSLEGACRGCNQQDINSLTISWSLWVIGEGFKDGNAQSRVEMATYTITDLTRVSNLLAMTRVGIDSEFLVLRANSLESGATYVVRVEGRFGEGATGFAEYVFVTASSPTGGECRAIKGDGSGHEELITLSCTGWTSSTGSTELIYDYFYKTSPNGTEYLFQYTRDGTIGNIRLPLGLKEYNYTLYMKAVISDELGTKSEAKFEYQSFPSEEDDAVLIEKLLEEMTINSTLRTLEMESYSQFTNQYIVEVSSQLNAISERAANLKVFKEASRNIRTRMSRVVSEITMDDIKTVRETANAVSKLATVPDECEVETQLNLNKTLSNMVRLIIQQSAITDSIDLWGTLNTVSEALGNVVWVVSHLMDGQYFDGNNTKASVTQGNFTVMGKILIENVIDYVRLLSDSYLGHVLPKEEPIQVRSSSLYFTLNRDFPAGFSGRRLHCGVGGVDLPDNFGELGILKDGNMTALIILDALVTSTPFVSFVWSPSASLINSHVLSIEIRNYSTQKELNIENLTKPVDLWIRKGNDSLEISQGKVEYTKILKHSFEVRDNRSSITIEVDLLGEFMEQPSLVVYLRKGEEPTMKGLEGDKIRVVPQLSSGNTSYDGPRDSKLMFFNNAELNGTAAGEYFVIIEYNGTVSGAKVAEEDRTVEYLFSSYASECLYWDELNHIWIGDGCVVGPLSNSTHTQCLCTHMSSFASSFFVPPNKIDWGKVNMEELLKNPIVAIIVCCIFLLYSLLVVWARRKDKADLLLVGVTPLPSNDPRDLFGYEVIVFTGFDSSAGTTADVFIVLTGAFEQTQTRRLLDLEPVRRKFQRGNIDNFLLTVPRPLGEILGIRIWHNNTGLDPSWFLSRVLVRDLQTDKVVWFVCDRWLAVEEDDGQINRTLLPASKEELVKFNFIFSTEVRKNLSDGHLWYSVLYRPFESSFTRVQRLSCCLSILTCSMLANAMFYKDGAEEESDADVEVKIGPIRLSTNQIGIGVMSSLVVLPVNLLIVNIFRKARPKDWPILDTKSSDHQSNASGDSYFDGKTSGSYDLVKEEKEDAGNSDTNKEEKGKKEKKAFTLPHVTIYIAYGLIFVASITSAVFTIFYSLTFGEAKSQRWVSSMMISFWQDVIISQPLKVIVVAVLFALIIKDPDKAIQDEGNQRRELGRDEEWIHEPYGNQKSGFDFRKSVEIPKPPSEEHLHIARQRRKKQKQMKIILREISLYFAFILVLCVVAYGSRDTQAYAVTRALTDIFPESKYTSLLPFDKSSEASKLWNWIENSFVPSLHPQYWYGPFIIKQEEELWSQERLTFKRGRGAGRKITTMVKGGGSYAHDYAESFESLKSFPKTVTADRGMFYIVGVARLRQLRVKKDACTIPPYLLDTIKTCTSYYSWEDEEEGAFHPGWELMEESEIENLPDDHQSPWIWQSALTLNGTPFWGIFASYWGGGFVYNLAPTRLTTLKKIQDLHIDEWIDRYTRAVFAEFTVYNAHTNFFGVVTMLTEILPTGGYYHYPKVRSIRLYRYTGPEQIVIMVFEFIFFISLCIYSYSEAKQLFVLGKSYFKDPWNYVEIIVIGSSFSAIFLYLAELGFAKLAMKRMRANTDTFISFDYIIFLDEAYLATLGFAVFCFFLKFLKLLRFNRRLSTLAQTIKVSSKPLLSFFVIFLLFFLAYAQMAFLVFGPTNEDYATFVVASETMLSMTLGGFDFLGIQNSNRLIGPMFFISYMLFMFLILVNVFLSIVNEAFAEVSSNVGNQTNDYEVLDYIMYCLKEQIGRLVSPPFKPLYKPALTNFEKAVVDIEDFAENIMYTLDNISVEEQRQANWLEVDKISDKKKTLFHFLLHQDEDFDEDDIADAIPTMARFLSKYSLDQLQDIYQKYRERVVLSKFRLSCASSLDDSSFEGQYEDIDGFDEHVLGSWKSYEEPSQADVGVPNKLRSLDSIAEENEPIEANHTYGSLSSSDEHGTCFRSSFDTDNTTQVTMSKSTSLSNICVEIESSKQL